MTERRPSEFLDKLHFPFLKPATVLTLEGLLRETAARSYKHGWLDNEAISFHAGGWVIR
jgi:hypothetical protein